MEVPEATQVRHVTLWDRSGRTVVLFKQDKTVEFRNEEKRCKLQIAPARGSGQVLEPLKSRPENGILQVRTKNWHKCPWLKRLWRNESNFSREFGKLVLYLR